MHLPSDGMQPHVWASGSGRKKAFGTQGAGLSSAPPPVGDLWIPQATIQRVDHPIDTWA